jgi:hypothetical protein
MAGMKHDAGKNRLDLMFFGALWEIGRVHTMGAEKYADRNCESGLCYSRVLAAALRHVFKWAVGHKVDEESGLHHLAHAAWGIMMLLHMELLPLNYAAFDDLPDYREAIPNASEARAKGTDA